jgi:hypothetical protein
VVRWDGERFVWFTGTGFTGGLRGQGSRGLQGFTGVYGDPGSRFRFTGTGYELHNFAVRQEAPDFLDWTRPAPLRHTPSRRPHGSVFFRSREPVKGAPIARGKTGVSRRPMRRAAAGGLRPLTGSRLRKIRPP